jgi:hypothetical protein
MKEIRAEQDIALFFLSKYIAHSVQKHFNK